MATLVVKATPSDGTRIITLAVDGKSLGNSVTEDGGEEVEVDGSCGDTSRHVLVYTFTGKAGETLGVTVTCGATEVCNLKKAEVSELGEPYCTGWKRFGL